jgi:hypothetical protein
MISPAAAMATGGGSFMNKAAGAAISPIGQAIAGSIGGRKSRPSNKPVLGTTLMGRY